VRNVFERAVLFGRTTMTPFDMWPDMSGIFFRASPGGVNADS
jgi:hypothetical protein